MSQRNSFKYFFFQYSFAFTHTFCVLLFLENFEELAKMGTYDTNQTDNGEREGEESFGDPSYEVPTLPEPIARYDWCAGNDVANPLTASIFPLEFPRGMHFVITAKPATDFQCPEAKNDDDGEMNFINFACRRSNTRVLQFFKTFEDAARSRFLTPWQCDLKFFLWDEDGTLLDGLF